MANDTNNEAKPLTETNIQQNPKIQPKYSVHRDVLLHEVVIKKTGYGARDKSIPSAMKHCWKNWSFFAIFTGVIPILQWLPKYSLKHDFVGDCIAGVTVAIMAIPHGMAYGLLAGVSAGNGLYVGIFPVLVYMLFGTSRHISIGTFAVISMMTLSVVQTYATEATLISQEKSTLLKNGSEVITPLEVATALAFTVGIIHLIMGFLCLGVLAALLSDPLVNGFTTGAACHVITSQLKDVFGISLLPRRGAFKIIYTIFDVCKSIPDTNIAAFVFCLGVMLFMIICNEYIKPCLQKRCRFPLPAELIAVIGCTLISKFLDMNVKYGIVLVGPIPQGLPMPDVPRLNLVPVLAVDSLAIVIVSYSVVISMGLTFAKKHSYEIHANQELIALGISNVVSSFFACYPLGCSLSRSVIQEKTGGVTQVASLVGALILIATLLWIGPFFSNLPRCVLAGVIIVALKAMFMQAKQLKKFAKQGKLELLTWVATFLSVVIIDIDIGLLIGVAISLLAFYVKGLKPYSTMLGTISEAEGVYVDINHHRNATEIPEIKIFRYTGSLNFASKLFFRRALYRALDIDTKQVKNSTYIAMQQNGNVNVNGEAGRPTVFRFLVLDFSMLGHIDVAACSVLTEIMKELNAREVRLFIASPTDRVYDTIVHSMALGEGPFEVFPTLHDAVQYANACRTA